VERIRKRHDGGEPTVENTSSVGPSTYAVTLRPRTICDIRLLTTEADLVEAYRLRHRVYGSLGYLSSSSPSGLEIDHYDACSIAFGAFDRVTGALIGTLRLIIPDIPTHSAALVKTVLAHCGDASLVTRASAPPRYPLPSIVSEEIERGLEAFNVRKDPVREFSRYVVHPNYRNPGISRGLALLGLAHAVRLGPSVLIASCLHEHLSMYAKYGFHTLPQIGLQYFDSVGQTACLVASRTDRLSALTEAYVEELLRSMAVGLSRRALVVGPNVSAMFCFTPPRQVRRHYPEGQVNPHGRQVLG
jgi:Acetyltransferase (GNAT) domain